MLLNVRSPYRRQKRDSIIRSLFRRPYTGIEILTIIPTILPFFRSHRLLLTFLPSCHIIDFFLPFCDYINYFLLSSRSHRLFLIFLPSCDRLFPVFLFFCDHTDYQTTYTHSANQNRAGFTMPRHGK
jgi:hypothetical protein